VLRLIKFSIAFCLLTGVARAAVPLERLAEHTASVLTSACPKAAPDDMTAFNKCAAALRAESRLPFMAQVLWGGDQASLPIKKKHVTDFQSRIFQELYLPLFYFTGKWAVRHDDVTNADVVRVEAFFRNDLPPGEYPYPFWHSADKWNDYERANEIDFYVDHNEKFFAITRARIGDETARGPYAHREPPVFDGKWTWRDAQGRMEPKVSLFSSKYSADNPFLRPLDKTYTDLAMQLRDGTCMDCHTPINKAGADHLVIFQTPMHAAGAIGKMLHMVKQGDMPQNEWGEKVPLGDKLKTALLKTGESFRRQLAEADEWEGRHHGLPALTH